MRWPPMLVVAALACGEPPPSNSSAAGAGSQAAPRTSSSPSDALTAKREAGPEGARILGAMKSMAGEPAESRQAFAGAALAELTTGRLVEPLRKAFGELQSAPGDQRRLVFMKAFATPEGVAAWTKVCAAGPGALAGMVKLRREEGAKHLWDTCKLSGSGLISAEEAVKTDGLALAAAMTAADQLGKAEVERELLAFFLKASPAVASP